MPRPKASSRMSSPHALFTEALAAARRRGRPRPRCSSGWGSARCSAISRRASSSARSPAYHRRRGDPVGRRTRRRLPAVHHRAGTASRRASGRCGGTFSASARRRCVASGWRLTGTCLLLGPAELAGRRSSRLRPVRCPRPPSPCRSSRMAATRNTRLRPARLLDPAVPGSGHRAASGARSAFWRRDGGSATASRCAGFRDRRSARSSALLS